MRPTRAAAASIALLVGSLAAPVGPAAAPAGAQGPVAANVTVANMAFSPSGITVRVGETVTWTFEDAVSHTATSDNGFFNTGLASGGAQRTVRFRSAGTYPYHCMPHPHMTGRVRVPVTATGSRADGWKLVWLAGDNPRNRSYDVQLRRVGTTTWTFFRKGTTKASGRYDPGRGTWQVRARTLKASGRSGWSPVVTLP